MKRFAFGALAFALLVGSGGFAQTASGPQDAGLQSIPALRARTYPGSAIAFERTLAPGVSYRRYLASYRSDGLKIYALLTVPAGPRPKSGWPAIIFNHGYIPPAQYRTTQRYEAYVDALARAGYIVFKIDYRGHGDSEGQADGAYWSSGYTVDVLNAVSSLARFKDADASRLGMWGHSMGGFLTLRAMVIDRRIKAGVIWAGVVAPYSDLLENWSRRYLGGDDRSRPNGGRRAATIARNGTPQSNPDFWNSVSANNYLNEGVGPIQLHHGTPDTHVPVAFSRTLARGLRDAKQPYEYFEYAGNDHNLSQSFSLAMRRTVAYFDRNLKAARRP